MLSLLLEVVWGYGSYNKLSKKGFHKGVELG